MNNTFYYENNLCGLKRTDFQKNIGGKETDLFILTNDNGAEMAITNYGGAILASWFLIKMENWPMSYKDMTI